MCSLGNNSCPAPICISLHLPTLYEAPVRCTNACAEAPGPAGHRDHMASFARRPCEMERSSSLFLTAHAPIDSERSANAKRRRGRTQGGLP